VVDLALSYPNVVLDLCGTLVREGVVEALVERVGAKRLMLGTDIPFNNGLAQIGTLLYAGIAKDDLALIAGGNAKKLFGLPQGAQAR
jgi:predicted TIM-barrel fold metal-dependent hydrolase